MAGDSRALELADRKRKEEAPAGSQSFDDLKAAVTAVWTLPDALGAKFASRSGTDVVFAVGAAEPRTRMPAHRLFVAARSEVLERLCYPNGHAAVAFGKAQALAAAPEAKAGAVSAAAAGGGDDKEKEKAAAAAAAAKAEPLKFDSAKTGGPAEVVIADCTADAFSALLKFCYTGDVLLTVDNLSDVLFAARRYGVVSLRRACVEFVEHHPTPQTVCALLATADTDFDPEVAVTYLEDYAAACVDAPAFTLLPRARVDALIAHNQTHISEVALFRAAWRWAEADLMRRGKPATNQSIAAEVTPLAAGIRFGAMSLEQLSAFVVPTGVLTSDQLLALYAHVGAAGKKPAAAGAGDAKQQHVELPKLPWPMRLRVPRNPRTAWRWDAHQRSSAGSIALSGGGLTVQSAHSPYSFCRVYGDVSWSKATCARDKDDGRSDGKVKFEVALTALDKTKGAKVIIGFVPAHDTDFKLATMPGVIGTTAGWVLLCGDGSVTSKSNGTVSTYTTAFREGDRVGVRLDLSVGTVEFFKNGTSLGVAFRDIAVPVKPIIAFHGTQSVRTVCSPAYL